MVAMEEKKKTWHDGIPAPVGRDGNVVPLDTRKLVDDRGHRREVVRIGYSPRHGSWCVSLADGFGDLPLGDYALAVDDSLGKLADDLERYVGGISSHHPHPSCSYFDRVYGMCDGCPADVDGAECSECYDCVIMDAARRARALAGSDAND